MIPTPTHFILTPLALTSLDILLLTVAFLVFLAQRRPYSPAKLWLIGYEASLAFFLTAHLLVTSAFLPFWYPFMYLSFIIGMGCLLQFAFMFPQPLTSPASARWARVLSGISFFIGWILAISFWSTPQSAEAHRSLRIVGVALGLWQSIAVLLVLAYQTVRLDTPGRPIWLSWITPHQPAARAARSMLLANLAIVGLVAATLLYPLWLASFLPEYIFNIAWSISLMLMLAAFAITYLINTPDLISFQVKLILGTLTAVLTSIWLLSLIYPFQLQMKYDASRQADLQTVQVLDAFSAETIPPAVTFIAECGATSAPDLLFMRGQSLNLSRLCESGFLMGSVYGEGDDPLSEIQRFERDGRAYIVGFAFADYAKTMNQFALPIALVMVGSALIIIFLLPLVFYVNLVKPLASLSDGLQQINQGRLDVTVPVQTNDELGLLAKSFNEMAAELRTSVSDLENQFAESLRAEKSLREQKEQLRALSARLAEVEEAERRKLGHELHDQAGQNLTALSLTIKTVRTQLAMKSQDPSTVKQLTERLDDASELVRETTQRIRNVMEDLQPPALDEFGLPAALHWYATRFTPRTGIPVEITATDPAPRLSPQAEVAFFRIAQEALTNVAHHAQATQVRINMEITSGCTRMTIFDNGQGFDPRQPESDDKRSHWGLRLMAERAEAVGGTCRIESSAQQGTQIIVEVHS